jgi:hypothetical protein
MFFTAKKEEAGAISLFKKSCTYHGLEITVSIRALAALKHVVEAKLTGEPADITDREFHTLHRRGLVRLSQDGEQIVTELGLLVAALAEAGNLITIKGSK